ncbi:disulfide bond formation protein DsbB [Candidatus Palibaumannia cicadellinicola]|uniref:Disulfide bond formation protein B n=1 Tax=Candidatus Palibaumannia cicadellinicola TaxID=186490 RepID=A0A088MYV5_9GAMM|nr:disulfide bond formation protein DsbB [Candidatus Baumannia cicadellinicola]AIN47364.1 Periplasmic thiol:disulfide oxidoreductase DsbB, required for DsbA reoxidation [Candidatus Baumannia cicadellinicola]
MVNFLHRCSITRKAWLLLALTAFILELVGLYFQYFMFINPCVLCIYQRFALYGIMIGGLVGAISPSTPLRFIGLGFWLYSAWKGLRSAIIHTDIQLYPSPFFVCDFFVSFPSWLKLDQLLPAIFSATGNCTVHPFHFLSLAITQWMIIIFSIYLFIGLIILLVQFVLVYQNKNIKY